MMKQENKVDMTNILDIIDSESVEKLRKYLHAFDFCGKKLLYDSCTNRLWDLEEDEFVLIKDIITNEKPEELNIKCRDSSVSSFVQIILRDIMHCLNNADRQIKSPNPTTMILLVTEQCNFACTYCYGSYPFMEGKMSVETAKKAVDLAVREGIKDIVFFGGEPLLNFSTIEETVRYVEDNSLGIDMRITTNGSLVNEEIATFLSEHAILASVSMDGDMRSHDITRPLKSGKSSYEMVMNGIDLLKGKNILTLLEITHSARHSENLKNQLDTAFSIFNTVSCACVDGKKGCKHSKDVVSGERMKTFYNNVLDYEKELPENCTLIGIRELYDRICDGFSLTMPYCLCSDIGSRLIVDTEGNVFPCPEMTSMKEYCFGNINSVSYNDYDKNREKVIESLSSKKLHNKWFSNICETCIQHVSYKNGDFYYDDEKTFENCIESLIGRVSNEYNNE